MAAQQILAFTVTVPAGTPATAPVTRDVSFDQAVVQRVEIVIPDGHAGLTGIALAQAQQQVIPQNTGGWIISNDEKVPWDIADYLDNGSWQAIMYNTDVYDHSFHLRFLCANPSQQATPAPTGLDVGLQVGSLGEPPAVATGVAPPSA